MEYSSKALQALARKLVALEEARGTPPNSPPAPVTERVCQTLGIALIRFAGPDGFTSLLRRAVILASAEVPSLRHTKVMGDARLEGLDANSPADLQSAEAITFHLLGLLVTFIGEPLTFRLVRAAWPDDDPSSIGETDS